MSLAKEISEDRIPLTKEECYSLIKKSQKGDREATNQLIKKNQGLVYKAARWYSNLNKSISVDDFVSESNIGLLNCIRKFDTNLDFEFSTYANLWITQACNRLISKTKSTIRLPSQTRQEIKVYEYYQDMHRRSGRNLNPDEIFEMMNISKNSTKTRISNALRVKYVDSLDQIVAGTENFTLGETLESQELSPEDKTVLKDFSSRIKNILKTKLTERESYIICSRFGLNGDSEKTLAEIGKEFDITRERVRQIEAGALRKLRVFFKKEGLNW